MSNEDFDPLDLGQDSALPQAGNVASPAYLSSQANAIQAKAGAFRDLADRFYILWWNLPGMSTRDVDRELQDLFRMYMDLAPSLGVSRNTIPALKECCGRKRDWKDGQLLGDPSDAVIGVMPPLEKPSQRAKLGWGLGDVIARVTRLWKAEHCDACEARRLWLNSICPPIVMFIFDLSILALAAAVLIHLLRSV
jgi:hypothetical protein